jgi:TonB family protein
MKITASIIFVLFSFFLSAQAVKDTLYYDQDWKKASAKDYTFYRIVTPKEDKLMVEDHYKSGHIQMIGAYTSLELLEIADGHFLYFSDRGVNTRDEYYKAGLLEGEYLNYDTAGHLTLKMYFKNDKWDGRRTAYYASGKVYRDEIYKEGKFESGHVLDEKGKEIPFYPIEEVPAFPGGDTAMALFVKTHLIYPESARSLRIEGTVRVKFIVGVDGKVEEVSVVKSDDLQLNDAAKDVVRKLPAFKPGRQEGKTVRASFVLPITFRLVDVAQKH